MQENAKKITLLASIILIFVLFNQCTKPYAGHPIVGVWEYVENRIDTIEFDSEEVRDYMKMKFENKIPFHSSTHPIFTEEGEFEWSYNPDEPIMGKFVILNDFDFEIQMPIWVNDKEISYEKESHRYKLQGDTLFVQMSSTIGIPEGSIESLFSPEVAAKFTDENINKSGTFSDSLDCYVYDYLIEYSGYTVYSKVK